MIWLIGAAGMLGRAVQDAARTKGIGLACSDREVDITDLNQLETFFKTTRGITSIINCSAYTQVDRAESDEETAFLINVTGIENIGKLAASFRIPVIHISTDYVFDGQGHTPLKESDPVDPATVYGKTKLAGEKALVASGAEHLIFRISWLYGQYGPNFVKTMLRLLAEKPEIRVVEDQLGRPTWTDSLAAFLLSIPEDNRPSGIYHYCDKGETSWFGFACAIRDTALQLGIIPSPVTIAPVSSDAYPTPAQRPNYSVMDTDKLTRDLAFLPGRWQDNLLAFLKQIASIQQ